MSELVERIAKVLAEREGSGPWEGGLLGERGREMWRATARTALHEVRAFFQEKAMASEFEADPEYKLFEAVREIDKVLK